MLQVVMTNPAHPTTPATRYRRGVIVLGAVIGAHLLLLFLAVSTRDRMVERPVEPATITAMLLSPQAEPVTPAAPAAALPAPTPPAARPVVRAKPLPQMQPQARSRASRSAAATPAPVAPLAPADSAAPSATAQPAPAAPTPSPATAPATESAPATGRTPAAPAEPRNVADIDCAIPKPDYPDMSKRRRENGTAIVRFVVGLTGRIETMQLQSSSGYARLDEAALAAVHASVCQPYSENGAVVRAAYSQSFVFGLTD